MRGELEEVCKRSAMGEKMAGNGKWPGFLLNAKKQEIQHCVSFCCLFFFSFDIEAIGANLNWLHDLILSLSTNCVERKMLSNF